MFFGTVPVGTAVRNASKSMRLVKEPFQPFQMSRSNRFSARLIQMIF